MSLEILKAEINECLIRAKSKETIDTLSYLTEFAENHLNNGWISVDKKLPTPYINVLVYMVVPINDIPTSMVGIGYFDGESYWRYADHFGGFPYHVDDWWASDFLEKCIICWQPLPQPPKEQTND